MEFFLLIIVTYVTLFYFDILPLKFNEKIEPSINTYFIIDATASKVVKTIMSNIEKNICTFKIEYLSLIDPIEISKLIQNNSLDKNIHICYNDNNHSINVNIYNCDEIITK